MADDLLRAFLHGDIEGRNFHHADHVRAGFEILKHHDFPGAASPFCTALKHMASRAGNPGAYHETITLAFLSLIAERSAGQIHPDFEAFVDANSDLLDKSVLERWYPRARLQSDLARKTFLLPGELR